MIFVLTGMMCYGDSEQVVFDKGGILEQICPGKGYIDMSTVDPETSTKISQVCGFLRSFRLEEY